jgi:hypothetical protein
MTTDQLHVEQPAPPPVEAPPATTAPAETRRIAVSALAESLGLDVEQLAQRLGVNRRTLYKWFERGCPFTNEADLRAWVHFQGFHGLRPAPDTFADLAPVASGSTVSDQAPINAGTPLAPGSPAGAAAVTAEPSELTPKARLDMATRELRDLQAAKVQLEVDALKRILVHRDDLKRVVRALGLVIGSELQDLPYAALRHLATDFPAELRAEVRRAIGLAVDQARERFASEIRGQVAKVLTTP